ncbi:MAG: NAD(+) diphosphatase [Actinomycetota bacterium]|nr:NAD(+) diphosphatase [Actinomycetota bacterium]
MLLPLMSPDAPSSGEALLFLVRGADVAVVPGDPEAYGATTFIGTLDGRHCWSADLNDSGPAAVDPGAWSNLMQLYGRVDEAVWLAAGRAVQLVDWNRNHRYCGRCATATELSERERSRRCPACGLAAFPRLAPAMITLVERADGRVLLARNAGWPTAMYSCLAGFVEPGESVEAAVRREVREEVGIEVGTLRYFGSQPWPFPHSLMLGFHAEYGAGRIEVDGEEISDAKWFGRDDLPQIPGRISIARKLIDDWALR